jgi:DNA-binding PadR family transcriptional regulator
MQDKIVLGLLAIRELSLYDMKKAMEQSTAYFYNASSGSIHPALKKLEKLGLISVREQTQGKRVRKLYSRTDEGAKVFSDWIEEPLKLSTIKDEAVLRMFFLGHQAGGVEKQLTDYIKELNAQSAVMNGLLKHFSDKEFPEHLKHIAWFQMRTLKFGLEYTDFCLQFMEETLRDYQADFK